MSAHAEILWDRLDLALRRVAQALPSEESGHILTADDLRISDVRMLLKAATALAESRRAKAAKANA